MERGSEKGAMRPPVGSQPSFTAKRSWSMIPSQKIGAA